MHWSLYGVPEQLESPGTEECYWELQKFLNLIDWCQADSFWKSNVLSMPTFRKQYDRLRLRALDEYERNEKRAVNGGHRPYQNPTDMSVYHGDM